jgi:hypothetical protein
MSHIPPDHKSTSIHHTGTFKGTPQGKFFPATFHFISVNWICFFSLGVYRCEILGHEFMFSDQLETVISGLYGHDLAEVLHFRNSLQFIYFDDFYSMHYFLLIISLLIVIHYWMNIKENMYMFIMPLIFTIIISVLFVQLICLYTLLFLVF